MNMALELYIMNVGYGEAILLRCAGDGGEPFTMLIDGGSAEEAEFSGHPFRIRSAEQLAALGVTHLDVLLNTHIHEDHTCGLLQVVRQVSVGEYWHCPLPACAQGWPKLDCDMAGHPSGDKFQRALNAHREMLLQFQKGGVPVRQLQKGSRLGRPASFCADLSITVLSPPEDETGMMCALLEEAYAAPDPERQKQLLLKADSLMNNHSIMLMLEYCGARLLLCGDVNAAGYCHLRPGQIKADVLKIGHHGQPDGATAPLAEAISPAIVVLCASSDRRYGSMNPAIFEMFSANDPHTRFILSDTPNLPPWTEGVPQHTACALSISKRGEFDFAYIHPETK